jgi:hypothetical protein
MNYFDNPSSIFKSRYDFMRTEKVEHPVSSSFNNLGAASCDFRMSASKQTERWPYWRGGITAWMYSNPKTSNDSLVEDLNQSIDEFNHCTSLEF